MGSMGKRRGGEGVKKRGDERRGGQANTGMVKDTCNPSSEGARMNESLGATGASARPRDPT